MESQPPKENPSSLFVLPDQDTMLAALDVLSDNQATKQELFPKLLGSAGLELDSQGLIALLETAIGDFTAGKPIAGVRRQLLLNQIPDYIAALVADPTARADTLKVWEETIRDITIEGDKQPRRLKKAGKKNPESRTAREKAMIDKWIRRNHRRGI